ncbi:MAG: glycosyltransferase family 4 protein [Planctomycetes bacterium]|nr:glycosyltransferase family 4 protein [Planctomycetota bacterium]
MEKRILYVSAGGRISGAERSLLELVSGLNGQEYVLNAAAPQVGVLSAQLAEAGVKVHRGLQFRPQKSWSPVAMASLASQWARAVKRVVRIAEECGAQMIHSNNTAAQCIGGPASAFAHIPCLWHVRDFQSAGPLDRVLKGTSEIAVCASHALKHYLDEIAGGQIKKKVIHNAIDSDSFTRDANPGAFREEMKLSANTPVMLMVGQLVPWKRHDTFIETLAVISEVYPQIHGAIAGEDLFGEHSWYERRLQTLARRLHVESQMHFLGYRNDVATLMADADVLVVPSEKEPFGRVALEAMATETPVVATRAGGLTEIVEDEETGWLVPVGDIERTANAIKKVLDDPDLAAQMGQKGRQRVIEHFNREKHVRQIAEIYEQILAAE